MKFLLFISGLLCAFTTQAELRFEHGYVPEAPPPGKVMTAYMEIINTSSRDIDIVEVTSPQFNSIEMHTIKMNDGMARMKRLAKISIKENQRVQLQSGGMHLMMFKPFKRLIVGDKVELTFHLANGSHEHADLTVEKRKVSERDSHSHHHHHH